MNNKYLLIVLFSLTAVSLYGMDDQAPHSHDSDTGSENFSISTLPSKAFAAYLPPAEEDYDSDEIPASPLGSVDAADGADFLGQQIFGVMQNPTLLNNLIVRGANVDVVNAENITPLILAITTGNVPAFELLLDRGADLAALDAQGRMALQLAFLNSATNPAIWNYILTNGTTTDEERVLRAAAIYERLASLQ